MLGLAVAAFAPIPLHAQNTVGAIDQVDSGKRVSATVTVVPRHPGSASELTPDDVMVYENGERRPVLEWKHATAGESGLDLAILMDDSLASNIGLQLSDLRQFISSLPATTRVEVAYGTHRDASVVQNFTTDHQRAAKALRLPIGRENEISSIFQSLTDLVNHWPAGDNRRAALVVSDGIDLFYGVSDSFPTLNPSFQAAIRAAQRKGVTVYTIFANTAGDYSHNLGLLSNGQSSLGLLASETGGAAYFEVLETPLDFAPYLLKFENSLGQQYLLTFEARPGKSGYEGLRVTTEQPDVKVVAPAQVYVLGNRKT